MVSAILLWILRILLLLIVVLLIVPAGVRIIAEQKDVAVLLKILGCTFRLPEKKEKPEKKEEQEKEKEEKPKKGFQETVRDFGLTLDNIHEILRPFAKLLGRICRTIRVDVAYLEFSAGGKTPEEVGRNTGWMWAVYGNIASMLANLVKLKVRKITIIPDFSGKESDTFRDQADITASPVVLAVAAVAFLLRLMRFRKKYKTRTGGKHE